ncbi:NUDIX domain-containing protein [Actinomycetaceae bacterium MB13-C1-2]|nr:NUDIX domain-containing protein [Actinomycetaceae bacterium MB13-C1-2]
MSPRPVVATAIVDSLENPTLLLAAERSYPKSLAGMFELPGGKVDEGEDAQTALFREIREELGVEIIPGNPVPAPEAAFAKMVDEGHELPTAGLGFAPWPILGGRVMWVWFSELAPGEEAQMLGSHQSLVWTSPKEALSLPWLPTNIPIVKACIEAMARPK